jgi:hypothetical protein
MSFRDPPQMFVPGAKPFVIPWPAQPNWSRYDTPSCTRIKSRAEEAFDFREACALRYLKQAG